MNNLSGWFVHRPAKLLLYCLGALFVLILYGSSPAFAADNGHIKGGWYPWKPYQYLEKVSGLRQLTGLDVELFREVFEEELGLTLELPQIAWDRHQKNIQEGATDVAAGAFKTAERMNYAYFSEPYRKEDIVIISSRKELAARRLLDPKAFLRDFEKSGFKAGVVAGYSYGNDVDEMMRSPQSLNRFVATDSDLENLINLKEGRVDLVLIDRLVGGTLISDNNLSTSLVIGRKPLFSGDIRAMFSRKTTTKALVDKFNLAMRKIKDDGRFNGIVRGYLFPTVLGITVGEPWFLALENIGTAAFAFSGILLANQDRFSLFGAFVLASLPAVGGGILRDLIVSRDRLGFMESSHNLIIVIALVLVSYFVMHMPGHSRFARITKFFRMKGPILVQLLDALGLAAFTVVGVIVAVGERCEPLLLWGPIFSALTGAGGAILRDVIRADATHPTLKNVLYAEISLFWGFVLSLFVIIYAELNTTDPYPLGVAVFTTALGCFLTRLVVIAKKIKAPSFWRLRRSA